MRKGSEGGEQGKVLGTQMKRHGKNEGELTCRAGVKIGRRVSAHMPHLSKCLTFKSFILPL